MVFYIILYTLKLDTKFVSNAIRLPERVIVDSYIKLSHWLKLFGLVWPCPRMVLSGYFRVVHGAGGGECQLTPSGIVIQLYIVGLLNGVLILTLIDHNS